MYRQLNQPTEHPNRITVMDLLGGINPYVYREEYCAACGTILKTFGKKPKDWK